MSCIKRDDNLFLPHVNSRQLRRPLHICLSVLPSRCGIISTKTDQRSCSFHHMVVQKLSFWRCEDFAEIRMVAYYYLPVETIFYSVYSLWNSKNSKNRISLRSLLLASQQQHCSSKLLLEASRAVAKGAKGGRAPPAKTTVPPTNFDRVISTRPTVYKRVWSLQCA